MTEHSIIWLDYVPLINTLLVPIGLFAVSGLRQLRQIDLQNISNKFDALIKELHDVKGQINALDNRVARLEGIIMQAANIKRGD